MERVVFAILTLFLLSGCISEYNAKDMDRLSNLLVVEGYISEGTSAIKLSKSVGIRDLISDVKYINDATVTVESESGVVYYADSEVVDGLYSVRIEEMDPSTRYRLRFFVEGKEYESTYSTPMQTPDIDTLYWEKNKETKEVKMFISTEGTEEHSKYYNWTYQEIWEIQSKFYKNFTYDYENDGKLIFYDEVNGPFSPEYHCWVWKTQNSFILGSTENLTENIIPKKLILKTYSTDERFAILYYLRVNQQVLSKDAFEYYSNLHKNRENTGGIFDPMPSEMRGNIYCVSEPDMPVIGYVEASYVKSKEMFISREDDDLYDQTTYIDCPIMHESNLEEYPELIMYYKARFPDEVDLYTFSKNCFDCRVKGTTRKPDFWPNDH